MSGLSPSAADYRALAARLSAYAARKGVTFIGLGGVLGDNGSPALFLPGDSVHPNIEGHAIIAKALAPVVR
jgi:lysophospholipase L1-like esterase